jgi:hypothetical protein
MHKESTSISTATSGLKCTQDKYQMTRALHLTYLSLYYDEANMNTTRRNNYSQASFFEFGNIYCTSIVGSLLPRPYHGQDE